MRDERVTLSTQDVLEIAADALVIEDSGWLAASRGLAAAVDELYPQLRLLRARAQDQRGGPFALGAAVGLALDAQPLRSVIYAITFGQQSATTSAPDQRQRATPLDVAEAARNALLEADRLGAAEVVMPALGTRLGYHALPPTPKKLPRYVMGAAQLIGVRQALQQTASVQLVTIGLSLRDYAIFHELLGQPLAGLPNDGEHDE
jgi:O-acetyl-ADP-ribose deacetylase (regulator of RNase III)